MIVAAHVATGAAGGALMGSRLGSVLLGAGLHAVGDAISFVTPEDHGELRALERFIGRGIVRKKAEGFNYSAAVPAFNPADSERHLSRGQNQGRPQRQGRRATARAVC